MTFYRQTNVIGSDFYSAQTDPRHPRRKGVAGCSAEHPAVAFEPLRGSGYQMTCVALARGAEMSGFLLR